MSQKEAKNMDWLEWQKKVIREEYVEENDSKSPVSDNKEVKVNGS